MVSQEKLREEIAIWRVGALPGFVVIVLVIIARITGLLQSLEWSALDYFLRLRPEEPIDERIVIVGINEADIQRVRTYPIPDNKIAELLRRLQTYKPRVIGLDIVRDIPVKPGHAEIVAAFKDIKNLIAIEKVLPQLVAPPPSLLPEQVGFADAMLDADSRLRRSLLGTPTKKGYKLSLSVRLAQAYLSTEDMRLENGKRDLHAMRFGSTELPRFQPNSGGYVRADAGGVQVLLNFRSGQKRFRTVSLQDIETGNVNPNWLRDRIIIIGITAPSVKDIISTSATGSTNPAPGLVYGVEIQAHAVSQIVSAVLDGRPLLQAWSDGWEYGWIVVWGIFGIAFGRLTQSPLKNFLGVSVTSIGLVGVSFWLLATWGWWVPVAPALLVFIVNGVGLTAFYQYDQAYRFRLRDRQFIIDSTFDTIHNGPLQTLAKLLRTVREQDLPQNELLSELEDLNKKLRDIYEFMQQAPTGDDWGKRCYFNGLVLNLQAPLHELLYQVYSHTLERDLPYFQTLKVKIRTFDPIDAQHLSIEQKQGLCRFLEEALCNIGKYAKGATRLNVIWTQKDGWYILRITDNGRGIGSDSEGWGTKKSRNLARQLRGKFERSPLSPKGTLCELTWPVKKDWFWDFYIKLKNRNGG